MSPEIFVENGSTPVSYSLNGPVWLAAHGAPVFDADAGPSQAVLVTPAQSPGWPPAVAMVPDALAGCVFNNGQPLQPGVHPLAHATHLRIGGRSFWLSAQPDMEMTVYNPAQHGPGVRCFLSHAPLVPGQEIAICPGTPQTSCGRIYLREAYELTQQGEGPVRCPNCRFERPTSEWQPPPPKVANQLPGLLAVLSRRGVEDE